MRYIVVSESETGHCCFVASVIDTELPETSLRMPVCECFTLEYAHQICDALNAANIITKPPI